MGSIKFSFPYEMWKPIRLAILGSLASIKQMIYEKTSAVYNRARNLIGRGDNVDNSNNNQRNVRYNNASANIIDR